MNIKWIAIGVVGFLAAVALGALAVPMLQKGSGGHAEPEKAEQVSLIEFDEFLVNLADTQDQHYLKTVLVMEVEGEPKESEEKEMTPETAQIRDAVIATMSRRTFRELLAPEGKNRLRGAIRKDVNRILGEDAVRNVYFTEFTMQ